MAIAIATADELMSCDRDLTPALTKRRVTESPWINGAPRPVNSRLPNLASDRNPLDLILVLDRASLSAKLGAPLKRAPYLCSDLSHYSI